jgi:hypothetical protein
MANPCGDDRNDEQGDKGDDLALAGRGDGRPDDDH